MSRVFAAVAVSVAVVAHITHLALQDVDLQQPASVRETLPSEEAIRLMSLGYDNLVADYYWLRTISHFGTTEMHALDYPNLEPLLRRTLALDPYFAAAYKVAGTALTLQGQNVPASVELLKQGLDKRPDVWEIPFFLGFNAYFFAADYALGARAMAIAATHDDAPPHTGPLALRLAAEAGTPDVGLQLIDTILETIEDQKIREVYLERRDLLRLELELMILNDAVERFVQMYGRRPQHLEQLVTPGVLSDVPAEDPLGGTYVLGADGRVRTTNDERRLRLPEQAKGLKR